MSSSQPCILRTVECVPAEQLAENNKPKREPVYRGKSDLLAKTKQRKYELYSDIRNSKPRCSRQCSVVGTDRAFLRKTVDDKQRYDKR